MISTRSQSAVRSRSFSLKASDEYSHGREASPSPSIFMLVSPSRPATVNHLSQVHSMLHTWPHSTGPLFASRDRILNGIIALAPDLGFEIDIDELPLLSIPLPIRIPIIHDLIRASIANFEGCVRQGAFGGPLEVVAGGLGDEEGLAAALVAVFVDAFLDCVVHDAAAGDFGCFGQGSGQCQAGGDDALSSGEIHGCCCCSRRGGDEDVKVFGRRHRGVKLIV